MYQLIGPMVIVFSIIVLPLALRGAHYNHMDPMMIMVFFGLWCYFVGYMDGRLTELKFWEKKNVDEVDGNVSDGAGDG